MITPVEAEELFFREAALLDEWRLDEWLQLLTDDVRYLVPSLEAPEAEPPASLYIISDDRRRLESRITQLQGRHNWAENPRSRTRRLLTNVRVLETQSDEAKITANFAIWRFRGGAADTFVGRYVYRIVRDGGRFLIRERRAILDMETLRPQGKISFLL